MIADVQGAFFEDIVQERRSVRKFQSAPVSRALIADILKIALWAPSPHNVQPWRFTALFDASDKARLADAMAARLRIDLQRDGTPADSIDRQTSRSYWRVTSAPVVLVCSLVSDGLVAYEDERRTGLEWQMAVQSVGAVLQTLFLVAASRDVGTCWMAAPMYCPDEVKLSLTLPDEYVPQALVLAGYPEAPGQVRNRRSFEEIVDFR